MPKKYIDDLFKKQTPKVRWYKRIKWAEVGGNIGACCVIAFFGAVILLIGWGFYALFTSPTQSDLDEQHYRSDFSRFCTQVGGKAQFETNDDDLSALCLSPVNKLLVVSSKPDSHTGLPSYDTDFTKFCTIQHGKTTLSGRDLCITDGGTLVMKESKKREASF